MDFRLRKEFLLCKCDQTFLSSIRSESRSQIEIERGGERERRREGMTIETHTKREGERQERVQGLKIF